MTNKEYTFIDLFAGLGGFHLALQQLGCKCVFASELKEDLRKLVNDELDNDFNIRIEYIKEEKTDTKNEFENLMKDSGVPFQVID